MTAANGPTDFQTDVARTFFSLPEAESFLLAGGLALLALGLSDRPTQDIDAFTSQPADVHRARAAFETAAAERGWVVDVRQSSDTFARLHVHGTESVLVDLALDSPPGLTPTICFLGPTFAPDELAARKLLALFDRAMPRDFVDLYALAHTGSRESLVALAQALDPGLMLRELAVSMGRIHVIRDEDLPVDPARIPALRDFFIDWAAELRSDM